MLVKFSVVSLGGTEVATYCPPGGKSGLVDSDLFSGFLEAVQLMSQELGTPVREIMFADLVLYVQTFGDFTLRLLLNDKLDGDYKESLFSKLAKQAMSLLGELRTGEVAPPEVVETSFGPLLADLLEPADAPVQGVLVSGAPDGSTGEPSAAKSPAQSSGPAPKTPTTPAGKVALVGLAAAGKTTIANLFFERLPSDVARRTTPTMGVRVSKGHVDALAQKLAVWDFGGQGGFRRQYLLQKAKWRGLDALVHVVDLQDPDTFGESAAYLRDVWNVVKEVNARLPVLSVFLHKYDPALRGSKETARLVARALDHFRDFAGEAAFHLTTVEDASCYAALLSTLLFSLPELAIKRIVEEAFLDHFTDDVLPHFVKLATSAGDADLDELVRDVHLSAVTLGRSFGVSVQELWLKALVGEYVPAPKPLSSNLLRVNKAGDALELTFAKRLGDPMPVEVTRALLGGLLEGMARAFRSNGPTFVGEDDHFFTWKYVASTAAENPAS
ncbi:MAG: hypothetical protein Kow0069_08030 [Promethearchaeota archaeon]